MPPAAAGNMAAAGNTAALLGVCMHAKLQETPSNFGAANEMLVDYVLTMLEAGKDAAMLADSLTIFLGAGATPFAEWAVATKARLEAQDFVTVSQTLRRPPAELLERVAAQSTLSEDGPAVRSQVVLPPISMAGRSERRARVRSRSRHRGADGDGDAMDTSAPTADPWRQRLRERVKAPSVLQRRRRRFAEGVLDGDAVDEDADEGDEEARRPRTRPRESHHQSRDEDAMTRRAALSQRISRVPIAERLSATDSWRDQARLIDQRLRVPMLVPPPAPPCPYFPLCSRVDCRFSHPFIYCKFFPTCNKGAACPFAHMNGTEQLQAPRPMARINAPCWYGDACMRPDCIFVHAEPLETAAAGGAPRADSASLTMVI